MDKPTKDEVELFTALLAVFIGAINQGSVDRVKLIEHLEDFLSTTTDAQSKSKYGWYLRTAIKLLSETQNRSPQSRN